MKQRKWMENIRRIFPKQNCSECSGNRFLHYSFSFTKSPAIIFAFMKPAGWAGQSNTFFNSLLQPARAVYIHGDQPP